MNENLSNNNLFHSKNLKSLPAIIESALIEDNALNDITSDLTIDESSKCRFQINARQDLIFCGKNVVDEVFFQLKNSKKFSNCDVDFKFFVEDGAMIKKSSNIVEGVGNDKIILAGERLILNLIQHLSAIATGVHKFVAKLDNPKIKILDTRKTIPNLRELQKYAVLCGGGANHRFSLADMILIKDNHINACRGIENALNKISKLAPNHKVEIECESFLQVSQAIKFAPNIIMLDNMKIDEMKKSIDIIRQYSPKTLIEISGGVSLDNIQQYSSMAVDFISIGSLTNSIQNVDIGLDFL